MDIKSENPKTSINISEEVICTIAHEAVKELDGVFSLANLPVKAGIFAGPGISRPVRLSFVSESAHLDVGVVIEMNCKIRDVAEQVQSVIKTTVQDMTGIAVSKVNVYVQSVHVKEESEE